MITQIESIIFITKNFHPMPENLVVEIVKSIPPVTRFLAAVILSICFLVYTEIVSPYKLIFCRAYLLRLELHRAITSFFYFGPPNIDTIIHIIFLIRHSKMLEESFINMCDYVYFLFIVGFLVFITSTIFNFMILGPVVSSVITYVWTRQNPNVQIQIFRFSAFSAFYLPFVLPLFSLISEGKIMKNEIMGIIIGHFYYFFKFIFPKFGYDFLKTPVIFQKILGEYSPDTEKETNTAENKENNVIKEQSGEHSPGDMKMKSGSLKTESNHSEEEATEVSISYEAESTFKGINTNLSDISDDFEDESSGFDEGGEYYEKK